MTKTNVQFNPETGHVTIQDEFLGNADCHFYALPEASQQYLVAYAFAQTLQDSRARAKEMVEKGHYDSQAEAATELTNSRFRGILNGQPKSRGGGGGSRVDATEQATREILVAFWQDRGEKKADATKLAKAEDRWERVREYASQQGASKKKIEAGVQTLEDKINQRAEEIRQAANAADADQLGF